MWRRDLHHLENFQFTYRGTPRRTERIPVISATKRATKTCVSDKGILVKKGSIQKKKHRKIKI